MWLAHSGEAPIETLNRTFFSACRKKCREPLKTGFAFYSPPHPLPSPGQRRLGQPLIEGVLLESFPSLHLSCRQGVLLIEDTTDRCDSYPHIIFLFSLFFFIQGLNRQRLVVFIPFLLFFLSILSFADPPQRVLFGMSTVAIMICIEI